MKFLGNSVLTISILALISCAQKPTAKTEEKNSPPPCVNSICQIRVEGYPQEIAVLIPPYSDFKNVTVFFHDVTTGKERDKNLSSVMTDFEIVKCFQESKTNRVLIIPYSSGQNAEYRKLVRNKLELQVLIANIYKSFGMTTLVEDLHLIGHGESHLTVQDIVKDNSKENQNLRISQVTLLDATYPTFQPQIFTKWLKSGENKMTLIYFKNSPAEKKALQLWKQFSGQKPGQEGGFNLADGNYLTMIPESELPRKQESHWLLVRKWFSRIL